ncbi:MAG: hypothetical protein H0W30_18250 [Gemmatimonadaceae bacterium]|nr:hypothetical protein [Gemmatimonadaceae bacterium]
MPKAVSTEFRVNIDGLSLTSDQKKRVNQAVQKAVLSELTALNIRGGFRTRFPREWLGIWIDLLRAKDLQLPRKVPTGRVPSKRPG